VFRLDVMRCRSQTKHADGQRATAMLKQRGGVVGHTGPHRWTTACHVVATMAGLLLGQSWVRGAPGREAPGPLGMAALKPIVDEGFRFKETDHFLIAYDTSYDAVRPLIGRLEGIHDAIRAFAQRCGIGVVGEFGGLPVVLFDDFDAFVHYANDVGVHGSMVGFYDHRTNVAAFCNTAHRPEMRRITVRIGPPRSGKSP